jgi:hypothetical protein
MFRRESRKEAVIVYALEASDVAADKIAFKAPAKTLPKLAKKPNGKFGVVVG